MSISHHSAEYSDMKDEFVENLVDLLGCSDEEAWTIANRLFSIMNDYGAVDWT